MSIKTRVISDTFMGDVKWTNFIICTFWKNKSLSPNGKPVIVTTDKTKQLGAISAAHFFFSARWDDVERSRRTNLRCCNLSSSHIVSSSLYLDSHVIKVGILELLKSSSVCCNWSVVAKNKLSTLLINQGISWATHTSAYVGHVTKITFLFFCWLLFVNTGN